MQLKCKKTRHAEFLIRAYVTKNDRLMDLVCGIATAINCMYYVQILIDINTDYENKSLESVPQWQCDCCVKTINIWQS